MEDLKQLYSFLKCVTTPVSNNGHINDVEASLKQNLVIAGNTLDGSEFSCLKKALNSIRLDGPADNPCWQFTTVILRTLMCLTEALVMARRNYQKELQNLPAGDSLHQIPPDVLSFQQQSDVRLALQIVTCLGISRNLLQNVGIPLHKRSHFGHLLDLSQHNKISDFQKHQMLYSTVKALFACCESASLGSMILTKHVGELLAALLQLCYAPLTKRTGNDLTNEASLQSSPSTCDAEVDCDVPVLHEQISTAERDREHCFDILRAILERTYRPTIVRELLVLRGMHKWTQNVDVSIPAPAWLRRATHRHLSEILTTNLGVKAVIQGILDNEGGTQTEVANWKKCDIIAKIIVNKLKCLSSDSEKQVVSSQVLALTEIDDGIKENFCRVSAATVYSAFLSDPQQAKQYFLDQLLKPLASLASCVNYSEPICSKDIVADCILRLHKVFVVYTEPNCQFVSCLTPVIGLLFHIYTVLKDGVSYLRSAVEDLLCTYLKHGDITVILKTLHKILFEPQEESELLTWNPTLQLSLDDNAGIDITANENSRCDFSWIEDDASKVSALLSLFTILCNEEVVGRFFLSLLQDLTVCSMIDSTEPFHDKDNVEQHAELLHLEQKQLDQEKKLRRSLLTLQMLSALCEDSTFQKAILTDKSQTITFLIGLLERGANRCKSHQKDDEHPELETLSMTMGILTLLLESQETTKTAKALKPCLESLQVLKTSHPSERIRSLAAAVHTTICTHGVVPTPKTREKCVESFAKTSSTDKATSTKCTEFQLAWEDLFDAEIPVRGHAILAMTKLILSQNTEATRNMSKILAAFQDNINHEDSYIYMMAIQGLAALADVFPDEIISTLITQYTSKTKSAETRMKLGEVLVKVTRILAGMTPKYRDQLLNAFLYTTRESDPFIRSSSLSNLGEVCKELKYALGPRVHEIFNCLSGFARHDSSAQVRQAAVQVITLLLRGLGKDAFKALEDVLRDMYRLLKQVYTLDVDDSVRLQAQLAFEELEVICKQFLFPKPTLQKKISILNP